VKCDGCGLDGDAACSFSREEVGYCRAFVDVYKMLDTEYVWFLNSPFDRLKWYWPGLNEGVVDTGEALGQNSKTSRKGIGMETDKG